MIRYGNFCRRLRTQDPADLATCDDASNDGFEPFDLSAQTAVILGAQSSAEVAVTYHRTQADAALVIDVNIVSATF